jgi:hypothetical protein
MKTNELIEELKQLDPDNECDVCVGTHPVRFPDRMPWYYDGRKETVVRDENNNPILVGYIAGADKIKLISDSIEDALLDNPDCPIDVSGITYKGEVDARHQKWLDRCISEGRKYKAWEKAYKEAREKGLPTPWIEDDRSWKNKLANMLKKVGLIEYEGD